MALFIPTYFSPIIQYVRMVQSDVIIFETVAHYQKQSYRNRCYICGANGKQLLNIPIQHCVSKGKNLIKDTRIANDFPWQKQHLKSLQSAYGNSPYFAFYKDDLLPIFTKTYRYLLELNIDTFLFINDALNLEKSFLETAQYEKNPSTEDYRYLADSKKIIPYKMSSYFQLFQEKYGFIPNLSILDLLFMEGPNTLHFLPHL